MAENSKILSSPKYWLAPYAVFVSTLYLWGYWGSFHVNVLEFIGLSEIVKAAVYPIASTFAFFAIGAFLGEIFSPALNMPAGGGAETKIGKILRKALPVITCIYLLAVIFLFLIVRSPSKWQVLPALIAIPVYLWLKFTKLLVEDFKSDGARSFVIFLLAALPAFAYGKGVLKSNDILSGKEYAYVVSRLPGYSASSGVRVNELPRYLGKAGDRYVFVQPTNHQVLFVAADKVKTLALKWYKRGHEVQPS